MLFHKSVSPNDVEGLKSLGFSHVGTWTAADSKPHKADWLRYKPGLYAFAIGSSICYIGMATALHRRLRNYSRRSFVDRVRAPREVHGQIYKAVLAGVPVDVYAKAIPDADAEELLLVERQLIITLQPVWNRTLINKR